MLPRAQPKNMQAGLSATAPEFHPGKKWANAAPPAPPQRRGGYHNWDLGWWVPYYVGTLKSFNVRSGYGFLECKETYEIYKSDVYIHKNMVPVPWHIGQMVEFIVHPNKHGQPQAQDCLWFPKSASSASKKSAGVAQDTPETRVPRYFGTLKSYSSSQGYGFIASDEMLEKHACDVYLDRGQLPKSGQVRLGQAVEFEVGHSKKGQPQARHVNWDPVPQLPRPSTALDPGGPWVAGSQGARGLTRILNLVRMDDLTSAVRTAVDLQENSEVVDYLSYLLDRLPLPSREVVAEMEGAMPVGLLVALSKHHRAHRLPSERVKKNMSWCEVLVPSLAETEEQETPLENVIGIVRSNLEVAAASDEDINPYGPVLEALRVLASGEGASSQ